MTCDTWIEALSAMADGEEPGVEPRLLQAHLERCPSCRSFAANIGLSAVRPPVVVDRAMPDLAAKVTKLTAHADRARVSGVLRALLGITAVIIAISAIPTLAFGEHEIGMSHEARHLGAFTLAYAVGLMVVAVRPARARTVLPVALVVAFALAVTAALDISEGHVSFLTEGQHIPELVSCVILWLLARATVTSGAQGTRDTGHPQAPPPPQPSIRVVGD